MKKFQKQPKPQRDESEGNEKKPLSERWRQWRERRSLYAKSDQNKDDRDHKRVQQKLRSVPLRRSWTKRMVNGGFILLFAVILLGVYNAFSHNQDINELRNALAIAGESDDADEENRAMRPGGQTFAQDFFVEYFDLSTDEEDFDSRMEQLNDYMAEGVEPADGIALGDIIHPQEVIDTSILAVEDAGDHQAHVYVRVETVATVETDDDIEDVAQTETYAVTIYGSEDGYAVLDLPQVSDYAMTDDVAVSTRDSSTHQKEESEAHAFLETFLEAYVDEDRADEMHLFFADADEAQALEGGYTFEGIEDLHVYQDEDMDADQRRVIADVTFEDEATALQTTQAYEWILAEDATDYTIQRIQTPAREVADEEDE